MSRRVVHVWGANELGLGCTVAVREAGPVTNPLCNILGAGACVTHHRSFMGLPLKCCEVRCSRHMRRPRTQPTETPNKGSDT